MADKVAKMATEQEELEEDFPIDMEWIVTDGQSGQYVDWRSLAKVYTEKKKKERTKRLMEPADPRVSKYGQGRRSQKAKEGRTILFNEDRGRNTLNGNEVCNEQNINKGVLKQTGSTTRGNKNKGNTKNNRSSRLPMSNV